MEVQVRNASGTPVALTTMWAYFAARWSPGLSAGEHISASVGSVLGKEPVVARVAFQVVKPASGDHETTMIAPLAEAVTGEDEIHPLIADLASGSWEEPLCLVTVMCELPQVNDVLWLSDGDGLPEVSYSGLSRIGDLALDLTSEAMRAALDATSSPGAGGPLCRADLVGAGAFKFGTDRGKEYVLPFLPSSQVGSWGINTNGRVLTEEGGDLLVVAEDFSNIYSNIRRLRSWDVRFFHRLSRGEWAEAVVAYEASQEQLLWHILDAILIDHNWRYSDFETQDLPGNSSSVFSAVQAHLGGSSKLWDPAREAFSKIWIARNDVIHRGAEADSKVVTDLMAVGHLIKDAIDERLKDPKVAARHPLTTWLHTPKTDFPLGSRVEEAARQLLTTSGILDTRVVNDVTGLLPGFQAEIPARICSGSSKKDLLLARVT
ncbi:hypothetical protein ACFWFU_04020 [Streptomyces sp. NPDC060235]|uniref:hypothetical protein n=1 Tax=Streptomyces sp. NPDC060235 TaxID=3347080 RepID=UPI0036516A00